MRASNSESPGFSREYRSFNCLRKSSLLRCCSAVVPEGDFRCRIGVSPWRNCVPWKVAGRNPALQFFGPPMGSLSSSKTTKDGRLRFADPSPYVVHAPMAGRPARMEPVFIWQTEPT